MLNKKQIDNLSKYCYDISKLVTGIAVIGNLVSEHLSLNILWSGFICALTFLIFGLLLDREVNKNDEH